MSTKKKKKIAKAEPKKGFFRRAAGAGPFWGDHDLSELPQAAYNSLTEKSKGGKDSYTLNIREAKIEVHLKRKAFFLQQSADGVKVRKSFGWAKHGGHNKCWYEVLVEAGIK